MMVDIAFIEGVLAGLGWGVLIGGVLGVRWFVALATEAGSGKGGERS